MKRRITFLLMGVLVALSMLLPCAAEDTTEMVTEVTTEVVADVLGEDVPETEDEWETFKAKISDSATWTMIGAAIVTILANAGMLKSKFDNIVSLVRNKADKDDVSGELKDLKEELRKTYNSNHKEIAATMKRYEEALKNTEANEQRLYAILTLFMTNCKISESAKAEILNILADVKKYNGDVSEFVAQAQEAIDEAIKEKEGDTPPTPNLDKLLNEDYMELG